MGYPTRYDPSYSFTDWQTANPTKPLPAPQVDNELENLHLTTDEIIDWLMGITRSDGQLKNGIVTADTLAPELKIDLPFTDPAYYRELLFLGFSEPPNTFWNDPYTPERATQARFYGRSFFGAAAVNDGSYWYHGGPGRELGFTRLDWFGRLANGEVLYNGLPAVAGSDGDFSQVYVLTDPDADIASLAVPYAAITAACESSKSVTLSTPRAVNAFAINNPPAGQHPSVWAHYVEAHRCTTDAGNTYAFEIEARDISGAASTGWNPYTTPGHGTIPICIGAGCGLPDAGGGPITAAMYFTKNPAQFACGLLFLVDSIGAWGPGFTKPAIKMPWDQSIQWYKEDSSLGAYLTSDASGNLYAQVASGGVFKSSSGFLLNDGQRLYFGNVPGDTYITGSDAANTLTCTAGNTPILTLTNTAASVAGNISVADGAGLLFAGGVGTYVGGSSSNKIITLNTNSIERVRVKDTGSVRFVPLASAPGSPQQGDVYMDSSLAKLRVWNGGGWDNLN